MRISIRQTLVCAAAALLLAACYPPQVQYPYTSMVTQRRVLLKDNLLALLPAEEQNLPAAQEEATWLADTAYKASAGIARINKSNFPGWAGNALISTTYGAVLQHHQTTTCNALPNCCQPPLHT
jgi:hypothetical protein